MCSGKFSAPFVVVVVVDVLFIYEMRRAPDGRLQLYGEISSVSYEPMRCFIESGGAMYVCMYVCVCVCVYLSFRAISQILFYL